MQSGVNPAWWVFGVRARGGGHPHNTRGGCTSETLHSQVGGPHLGSARQAWHRLAQVGIGWHRLAWHRLAHPARVAAVKARPSPLPGCTKKASELIMPPGDLAQAAQPVLADLAGEVGRGGVGVAGGVKAAGILWLARTPCTTTPPKP